MPGSDARSSAAQPVARMSRPPALADVRFPALLASSLAYRAKVETGLASRQLPPDDERDSYHQQGRAAGAARLVSWPKSEVPGKSHPLILLALHKLPINSLWRKVRHLAVTGARMASSNRFPSVWLSSQSWMSIPAKCLLMRHWYAANGASRRARY
jgi:hypothetical protein